MFSDWRRDESRLFGGDFGKLGTKSRLSAVGFAEDEPEYRWREISAWEGCEPSVLTYDSTALHQRTGFTPRKSPFEVTVW